MSIKEAVHERLTAAFIAEAPIQIQFRERFKEKTPDGGHRWRTGDLIAAQEMRRVSSNRVGDRTDRLTSDGRNVTPEFTLVGYKGASVKRGWHCTIDEEDYEVVYVNHDIPWVVHAEIVRVGMTPAREAP